MLDSRGFFSGFLSNLTRLVASHAPKSHDTLINEINLACRVFPAW